MRMQFLQILSKQQGPARSASGWHPMLHRVHRGSGSSLYSGGDSPPLGDPNGLTSGLLLLLRLSLPDGEGERDRELFAIAEKKKYAVVATSLS